MPATRAQAAMVSAPPMQKPMTPTLPLDAGQMLDRAGDVLVRGADEVEAAHHVVGLVRLLRHAALVEVGRQRVVARAREAIGDAADLVVQPPPFLDHDDARLALAGFGQVALAGRCRRDA